MKTINSIGIKSLGFSAAALLLNVLAISPAMATSITFAQYTVSAGGNDFTISQSGTTTTVTDANKPVNFDFTVATTLGPAYTGVSGYLNLSATSTSKGSCGVACASGDSFGQFGYSGSFTITTGTNDTGNNLLSGTFSVTGSPSTTGAQFTSTIGGTGGDFAASATAGNLLQLVMTSAYLNLTGDTQETSTFALSSVVPIFATGTVTSGQAYPAGSYNATSAGTFSTDAPGVTPEPATLSLMGGALIGLALLRRKKLSGK